MPFLTKQDLADIIDLEDIDVITDDDDTIVDNCIKAAITEAKGYMDRYDYDELFARTDIDQDPLLRISCIALACWYLCKKCAANQNTKDINEGAEAARAWLTKVQNGKTKPVDWPYKPTLEQNTFFHVSSYHKRNNNI